MIMIIITSMLSPILSLVGPDAKLVISLVYSDITRSSRTADKKWYYFVFNKRGLPVTNILQVCRGAPELFDTPPFIWP